MDTNIDLKNLGGEDRIVYVRPVEVSDLPDDLQSEVAGVEQLYAVHAPDGERLAVVKDREMAFMLARQNDFSPVTVH